MPNTWNRISAANTAEKAPPAEQQNEVFAEMHEPSPPSF